MKQFAYQDAHGVVYPAHPALSFQPGLIPGQYDNETRTFTPQGNPKEQVGVIITDGTKLQSGLQDDKGAATAPIKSGVAFTLPPESDADNSAELQARIVELEQALSDERERNATLEAQVLTLQSHLEALTNAGNAGGEGGQETGPTDGGSQPPAPESNDGAEGTAKPEPATDDAPPAAPTKRARKVTQ